MRQASCRLVISSQRRAAAAARSAARTPGPYSTHRAPCRRLKTQSGPLGLGRCVALSAASGLESKSLSGAPKPVVGHAATLGRSMCTAAPPQASGTSEGDDAGALEEGFVQEEQQQQQQQQHLEVSTEEAKIEALITSKASDAEGLLQIAAAHAHDMTLENVGSLLISLGASVTEGSMTGRPAAITCDERFFHLITALQRNLHDETQDDANDVASCLRGIAYLEYNRDTALIQKLLHRWLVVVKRYEGTEHRGLSRVMSALTAMRYDPGPRFFEEHLKECKRYGLDQLSWRALTYLIRGYVTYPKAPVPPALLSVVHKSLTPPLAYPEASQLAYLAVFLARLQQDNRLEAAERETCGDVAVDVNLRGQRVAAASALARACLEMKDMHTPAALANTISGICRTARPDRSWRGRVSRDELAPVLQHIPALLDACRNVGLENFTAHELAMVISGLVNVEYDGVNVMQDMALLCLRKNDDTLGIKDLRSLIHRLNMTYLGGTRAAVIKALAAACLKVGFDDLKSSELRIMIAALARLGQHPGDEFMHHFLQRCTDLDWEGFSLADLTKTFQSLCALRIQLPMDTWRSFVGACTREITADPLRMRDYSLLLHSLAMSGRMATEESVWLLSALTPRVIEAINHVTSREGGGVSDVDMSQLCLTYNSVAYTRYSLPDAEEEKGKKQATAEGTSGVVAAVEAELDRVEEVLRAAGAQAKPDKHASPMVDDVAKVLETARFNVRTMVALPHACTTVDILLAPLRKVKEGNPGPLPVAFEVETVNDHLRGGVTHRLVGKKALKRQVLVNAVSRGVIARFIPIHKATYDALNDQDEKLQYLEKKLVEAKVWLKDYRAYAKVEEEKPPQAAEVPQQQQLRYRKTQQRLSHQKRVALPSA